jgi:ammonium transporter, Amt family
MVIGVGVFNSGISGRRSAISMIWLPVLTSSVITLQVCAIGYPFPEISQRSQWYLWGYSITFAHSSNDFWGGTHGLTLHGVLAMPAGNVRGRKIPELLYALYQGMFASFT